MFININKHEPSGTKHTWISLAQSQSVQHFLFHVSVDARSTLGRCCSLLIFAALSVLGSAVATGSVSGLSKNVPQPWRILIESRVTQILGGPLVEVVVHHRGCEQQSMWRLANKLNKNIEKWSFTLVGAILWHKLKSGHWKVLPTLKLTVHVFRWEFKKQ